MIGLAFRVSETPQTRRHTFVSKYQYRQRVKRPSAEHICAALPWALHPFLQLAGTVIVSHQKQCMSPRVVRRSRLISAERKAGLKQQSKKASTSGHA